MELKEAIQKIKVILNGEEEKTEVETPAVEATEEVVEETPAEVIEEKPAIDVEALLSAQKAELTADFDAKLAAIETKFNEELTKLATKADQAQIVAILEQVSEIPTAEPSEKPRNVFAEHAESKGDKVAKAAEMIKQYRENNKK